MRLAFRIAVRFLTSNKGQTILIALGIAVGISVMIFIGSLIEGLQNSLIDTTIGRSSHITITADEKNAPLEESNKYERKLSEDIPGNLAVSPSVTGAAFLITGALESNVPGQIVIRGFNFSKANTIYKFDESLVLGRIPETLGEIAIGIGLSEDFDIGIGSQIEFRTPAGDLLNSKVVGIFDFKVAAINNSWSITTFDYAADIFNIPENASSNIEIQIKSPFEADSISLLLENDKFYDNVKIDNWKAQNEQLLSGLEGQSTSSLMIQIFVLISVVLGIASVLAITVLQKSKQIGILKAMGIKDFVSGLVFLFQGMILGLLGGILGIVLGTALLYMFTTFALQSDGTPVVPIVINWGFMTFSGAIAVVSATAASLFPARKSGKLTPIEVIRNG